MLIDHRMRYLWSIKKSTENSLLISSCWSLQKDSWQKGLQLPYLHRRYIFSVQQLPPETLIQCESMEMEQVACRTVLHQQNNQPLWQSPSTQCWQRQTPWRCQRKLLGGELLRSWKPLSSQASIHWCPCYGLKQTWDWYWQGCSWYQDQNNADWKPCKCLCQLFVFKAASLLGRSFQSCCFSLLTCSSSWQPDEDWSEILLLLQMYLFYYCILRCSPSVNFSGIANEWQRGNI